ncbi:MAG: hypothetical protein ACI4TK_17110, partial [Agathobacter sp.]
MEFIREQIKEKPISKKRVLKQMAVAIMCGVLFAITSCLVLLLCMPMLQNAFMAGIPIDTQQESTDKENVKNPSETEGDDTQASE